MDANIVNPFINATKKVLETMAFTKAVSEKPYLKKESIAKGDVTGVIGITGEISGSMSVTFDEACILKIVSNMFGEEMKKIDDEVVDAVGELTNMISGQARQGLEKLGKIFEAAIPSVINGKDHSVRHITSGPTIAIPFKTDAGNFTIEVCFGK